MKHRSHRFPVLSLAACAAYLLVCALLFTGVSLSRFTVSGGDSDAARAAVLAVGAEGANDDGDYTLEPGGTAEYGFTVTNEENGIVSEVALRYDVVVELSAALPEGVSAELDGSPGSVSPDGTKLTFAGAGEFEAGEHEENEHVLTFTASENTAASESFTVTVSVAAEQID